MTGEECYAAWAPDEAVWSRWVRPVLFVQMETLGLQPSAGAPLDDPTTTSLQRGTAFVLDMAGAEAVRRGLAMARRGWRPVPLFNGTHGPAPLIDVQPIAQQLLDGAGELARLSLPPDAPPVFLLDAQRMTPKPEPKRYDNRWVVLPQDFPSGTFLRSQGIDTVVVVTPGRTTVVSEPGRAFAADLEHVLLRWQEAGITITALDEGAEAPARVTVRKPAWYRRAGYALIAILGLRRANVGGFGGVIPEQTSGGGYA